jgi:hypothetical protein
MRPDTILSTGTGVALPHVPDNHQVWPFALVARHYLDGFIDCYNRAVRTSEEWIRVLGRHGAFTIDRVPLRRSSG